MRHTAFAVDLRRPASTERSPVFDVPRAGSGRSPFDYRRHLRRQERNTDLQEHRQHPEDGEQSQQDRR